MLISRLEISGFKSFPEKAVLEFNGGITGVVGPNGCGKSNILDSIRWVLGEQRTSVLRSAKMEEIIFSGTNTLKPTGMAEVSLTVKNNRGVLPIEYDDLVITRRLFRSGESEYFINRSRCRLKDINELFFDTGMGPNAYSVIQQGMIDAILSDKTEDRRSLFEEAAGVTKYKHRKKEAENKLLATEADLLRLGDIISEIEKQVIQLRRQAKRANRYSSRKDALKSIELTLASAMMFESHEQYDNMQNDKRGLSIELESLVADINKFETEIQSTKLRLADLESEASRFRQEESGTSLKAAEIESNIKLNKYTVESGNNEIEDRKSQIVELRNRIESLKKEIEEKKARSAEIENQKRSSLNESEFLEGNLADLLEELSRAESNCEQLRTEHSRLSEKNSGVKAESSSVESMINSLRQKMAETEKNAEDYTLYKHESHDDIKGLEDRRISLSSQIDALISKRQSKSETISVGEKSILALRDNLSVKRAELSGLLARKDLLKQLIEAGEGYSNGAKALLSWEQKPDGMLMPVSEIIDVPEKYRAAVNAALGDMGEIIPVRNFNAAKLAIEFLKSNNAGRASFLILDELDKLNPIVDRPNKADGFIGYLNDVVKYPEEYGSAITLLLGRIALFDAESAAINVSGEWKHFSRVTLDGLVLLSSAMVSGGKAVSGIFGRRYDLREIVEKSKLQSGEIRDLEKRSREGQENIGRLKNEFEENEKVIVQLEADKNKIEAELAQLNFDFKQKENEYSAAINEASKIQNEIEQYESKIEALKKEQTVNDEQLIEISKLVDEALSRVNEFKLKVKGAESSLTHLRIKNVELDGYSTRIISEIDHAAELSEEASRLIRSNEDGITRSRDSVQNALQKNETLKSELENCFEKRNSVKDCLLKIEGNIAEEMMGTNNLEEQLSARRKLKEEQTSRLHNVDVEIIEIESARGSIVERINLEFNISSIEPVELPDGQSVNSLKEQAEKIRGELQRMEPVNLMAAEDYERENDRYDFLIRQRDDLLDAKASLKEAIIKINITAEERFNSTFLEVENNYQKVFAALFENGEAHIQLEDPSAPLESPIKIMARPGGKKLLSVTQLSGGERALTAISLLFAIYLVKPSPFCILDEIDAPLDDINLMRFLKLIENFADNTQFIIITHNKLTMEASDILYGVTMETPGVSKVVSVKFGGGNGDGDVDSN